LSPTKIAPNRLHVEAQILSREVYKEDTSFYIVSFLVIKSNSINGYDRMKGAEQGSCIDVLISTLDWNQQAYEIGEIISIDVHKVSMKFWRIAESE
jgi:hypothetical protein